MIKVEEDCVGCLFTIDIPIDAHRKPPYSITNRHSPHSKPDNFNGHDKIKVFKMMQASESDPVYELYRKLEALHLYRIDKEPTKVIAHEKERSRKVPEGSKPGGRLFTSKSPSGHVKLKYMRVEALSRNTRPTVRRRSPAKTKSKASLTRLPPEIRCQIYEYLLVVGKIFPYNHYAAEYRNRYAMKEAENYPKPDMSIIQVSRLIRRESEPILYSKNNVSLPPLRWTKMFFERCFHNTVRCSWIRSVTITLSCRDAYMSTHLKGDEKLRREFEDLRLAIKGCAWYRLHPEMSQSIRDETVRQYRADCIIRRITDIAWRDKANLILEKLALEDLTVRQGHRGPLKTYLIGSGLWVEDRALHAFKAGFAFGLPKSLLFETFPKMSELAEPSYAAQKIEEWTEMRKRGEPAPREHCGELSERRSLPN